MNFVWRGAGADLGGVYPCLVDTGHKLTRIVHSYKLTRVVRVYNPRGVHPSFSRGAALFPRWND